MIKEMLEKLTRYENLDKKDSYGVMKYIMEGNATDAQIAAFLVALAMKGETKEEISGFCEAMVEKMAAVKINKRPLLDTCGTGGDYKNTFNISTTAAFIASAAGAAVAKHGNRSISSRSGSADVLEALGVKINLSPQKVAECIEKTGIGFIFAQTAHAALANAAKARKEVGLKTVFNILGPLANPAGADCRLLGVYDKKFTGLVAASLKEAGVKKAFVVCSDDGLDELSVCGTNHITELANGKITRYLLDPAELGFKKYDINSLSGGDAKENANILKAILRGQEDGARRDAAILNSAAAIAACGITDDLKDAVKIARGCIDSGKAYETLEKLVVFSNSIGEGQGGAIS